MTTSARPKREYKHMNPEKAREIRRLYFSDRLKQREIAARFGITQGSVSRIISGISWGTA